MYENDRELCQTAVLVGVDTGEYDAESSMRELEGLAAASGAQVAAVMIKKRKALEAATLLGSGAMEELRTVCHTNHADLIVLDRELTPSQQRNIADLTDTAVIDRTMLILDLFAMRARSSEGRIQVELAQLKYLLPRLSGKEMSLSRLGGGIGTRGPGETKLETDRRHVRRRIESLEEKLRVIERQRRRIRDRRRHDGFQTVVLVGYTNAGKSTLMNALTDAGVLVRDQLFATLDPTARALTLPDRKTVILIDTVGFISRLPHQLVQAFHSTLEVAADADLILHVCDASDPMIVDQVQVTHTLLDELGCAGIPVLHVMNKCDRLAAPEGIACMRDCVRISAREKQGLDRLLQRISDKLGSFVRVRFAIPFAQGAKLARVREDCAVLQEEYTTEGYRVTAMADAQMLENIGVPYELLPPEVENEKN